MQQIVDGSELRGIFSFNYVVNSRLGVRDSCLSTTRAILHPQQCFVPQSNGFVIWPKITWHVYAFFGLVALVWNVDENGIPFRKQTCYASNCYVV